MNGPRVLPFPSYKKLASFIKKKLQYNKLNTNQLNKITDIKDYQDL